MVSLTSQQPGVLPTSHTGQEDWPVFVCRQGIFLFDPRSYFPIDADEVFVRHQHISGDAARGFVAIPDCRAKDALLNQPPLGLHFSQMEAQNLVADTTGSSSVWAATDFGPLDQDKSSNQDFALAASMRVGGPGEAPSVFQFCAVADGVTTRTLWPERSARIAALSAWRVARRHVEANRGFSHSAFDEFRDALVSSIRNDLTADMKMLLSSDQEIIPDGWAPDTYRQFRRNSDLWYNSTLLVALVGPDAGFLTTCGDGGVVVRKTENEETKSIVVVRSTDDISVSGVVSLAADAMQFRQTRVALTPETRLELVMSTDGVDRSLRRDGPDNPDTDPYGSDFSYCSSSRSLNIRMTERLSRIADREIDNVSLAILKWPAAALPALAKPTYQGAIAAAGETVDDINLRTRRRKKAAQSRALAADEEERVAALKKTSGGTDVRPHTGPQSPIPGRPPAMPVGPSFPVKPKASSATAPSIWNAGRDYGRASSTPTLPDRPRGKAVTLGDLDNACEAAVWVVVRLRHIYASDRHRVEGIVQKAHLAGAKFSNVAFTKVIFCMFAHHYASESFNGDRGYQDEIEPRIDRIIVATCAREGLLTRASFVMPIKKIDRSESAEIVQSILDLLRDHGESKARISSLKKAFEL